MGQLVNGFIKSAYGPDESPATTIDKPVLQMSLTLDEALGTEKARHEAMRAVVNERNQLIHQWLATFNPNSVVSCEQLSARLDAQWDRTRYEAELLVSIVQDVRDLGEYLESDQFGKDLRRAMES